MWCGKLALCLAFSEKYYFLLFKCLPAKGFESTRFSCFGESLAHNMWVCKIQELWSLICMENSLADMDQDVIQQQQQQNPQKENSV